MSLFPGYATQGQKPSTSREIKKEDSEDELPKYDSYKIARAAKEKEKKREREQMKAKLEEKKDKVATKRFNLGDTTDEEDGMMVVDVSDSENEDTKRIHKAHQSHKKRKDALEERKRKNREKNENRNRSYDRISTRDRMKDERRSSSPDGDSPRDRRVKRERRSSPDSDSSHSKRKKRKKDKEHDEYIAPSKPQSTKSVKWDFMATVGVTLDRPDSYMIDARVSDTLLSSMCKTETRECAEYEQRFTTVLGGTYDVNKLFFPAKTASRSGRLLDKSVVLNDTPENKFVTYAFNVGDTIELSTVRCDEEIELSKEPTMENLTNREMEIERNKKAATESDPIRKREHRLKELEEAKAERIRVNSRLSKDPKNEKLWMELLLLDDQVMRLDPTNAVNSITAVNERKDAILKKAIEHIPRSSNLIVEHMKLKKQMNVSVEELNKEWKKHLHHMPNSLNLWGQRLIEMKHDSKQFTKDEYMDVIKRAANDLRGLLNGTMRSHVPEPGTQEYLIELLCSQVRMELSMGYIERAVSISQILIESNKFQPPPNYPTMTLPEVWNRNLPLIGEPNGKGWYMYLRDKPAIPSEDWSREMEESATLYDNELVQLGRAAERENHMSIFARHERIDEKYNWRPVRSEVVGDDLTGALERVVEYEEHALDQFPFDAHLNLVVKLVKELGGLFYSNMLAHPLWEDPMGIKLMSFGLLKPSLHSVPHGFPQFIDRILYESAPQDPQRGWTFFIPMSTARIRTRAWFIALRDSPFDMRAVMKELNDISSSAVKKWIERTPDTNGAMAAIHYLISVYETINLFEFRMEGMNQQMQDKSVHTLVRDIISKARIWSVGKRLDQIASSLNKSVVLTLATLLIRLPGSWKTRRLRINCVLLGKDGKTLDAEMKKMKKEEAKEEEEAEPNDKLITSAELIEVHRMVRRLRERGPVNRPLGAVYDPQEEVHATLDKFFGSDFLLAAIVESFFIFADAAASSHHKVQTVFHNIFDDVYKYTSGTGGQYEQFYMYYIYILKYGKKEFRRQYSQALEAASCPKFNTFIIREYIDSQQNVMKEATMLSDLKRRSDEESSDFYSLARLYAGKKQFTRIVASAQMRSDLVIANRVIKVFIEESKRRRDPLLWRYTLNLAAEFKNSKLGDEVFAQAFADCSWCRDLHLDYIEAFPDDGDRKRLAMVEMKVRLRGEPETVRTYIDYAKKKDEEEKTKISESA